MSRLFGPLRQVAFVIRDLDRALQYWTETLGVGPFFVLRNMCPENYRYRGRSSPSPRLSIALGNSGDVQVELIQQHDDRASAYLEFLQAGREGFQHVSSWLNRTDYDATMQQQRAAGVAVVHEGSIPGSGVRFAYFATDDASAPGGLLYEIADVLEPHIYPVMQMISDAARDWDGAAPVREITL